MKCSRNSIKRIIIKVVMELQIYNLLSITGLHGSFGKAYGSSVKELVFFREKYH